MRHGILADFPEETRAGLSFLVRTGERTAVRVSDPLVGTALLKALMGLSPLQSGYVSVDGEPIVPATARLYRRLTSYVPSSTTYPFADVTEMTKSCFLLKENADIVFRKHNLKTNWQQLDIDESLYVKPLTGVPPATIQRILIAAAGMLAKPILLLDQPTSQQDDTHRRLIAEYLCSPYFSHTAILMVTDDEALAATCTHTVPFGD